MHKIFLFVFILFNSFGETPFNSFYAVGGIDTIILKMEVLRTLPSSTEVPPVPKKDKISKVIPTPSCGFGLMKLCNRWIIIALEFVAKFKLQNSYDGEESLLSIKDNKFIVGAGIKFGTLLTGQSFLYAGVSVTNVSVKAKTTDLLLNPMNNFNNSGITIAFRTGMITAVSKTTFLDIYIMMSRKNFKSQFDSLKIKANSKIIGLSLIKKISRASFR